MAKRIAYECAATAAGEGREEGRGVSWAAVPRGVATTAAAAAAAAGGQLSLSLSLEAKRQSNPGFAFYRNVATTETTLA